MKNMKKIAKLLCKIGFHKIKMSRDSKLAMCDSGICKNCGEEFIDYSGNHI